METALLVEKLTELERSLGHQPPVVREMLRDVQTSVLELQQQLIDARREIDHLRQNAGAAVPQPLAKTTAELQAEYEMASSLAEGYLNTAGE